MTDIQNPEPDIEDRASNIRLTVENIIDASYEALFERFDKLKKRGINDDDLVTALRYLEHEELLEAYANWADIDIREDDNTTMNPVVPDPGNAPSYDSLKHGEPRIAMNTINKVEVVWP